MSEKTLIIYYSWSGNTKTVAGMIQEKTGAQLFEIIPELAYPVHYNACTEQAKKEIQSGFMPELKAVPGNLDNYDTIFVGSPNWWSTMAPPVFTFINRADLSGKTVVPFFSHGGGGKGHYVDDIKTLCKNSVVLDGLFLYGNGGTTAASEIMIWLNRKESLL